MATTQDTERAKAQAAAQFQSIREMVAALDTEDDDAREQAEQEIHDDSLSVEVRTGWYFPGDDVKPEEYQILLCTGGPAVRITGDLGRHGEPESAVLQYQDWFTPWETFYDADEGVLLRYARAFYFGD